MMVLANAMLAGSLLATGAQARGGGGGHMGGFGGGHMGGFGSARIGGLGEGQVGGIGAGQVAHFGHEHLGIGRRRFVGGGDYGVDCPYYPNYTSTTWPYNCTY